MDHHGRGGGGGVRVGIEDNIWFDTNRTQLARNVELVERIHTIAKANGRELMSAKEFRTLMNLKPGNGSYGR